MNLMQLPLLVLLVVALYALVCAVNPWGSCGKCHGQKRIYAKKGRRTGTKKCPRCRGTGIRLRIGRRVFNSLSDSRDRAHARPAASNPWERPNSGK